MTESLIRVLDETTANKIAAGEVVERPASVVKELVENSIDAGSTRIEIDIEEGGLVLIRVTDNGCGMSRTDAELSLHRHATSKIREAEDLNHIGTLGFRGEAIPSIASVSRFSIITRRDADLAGTLVEVEGGVLQGISDIGCPTGTSITVRNLFYNTPARLKYLKTTSTEVGHIVDILNRLALAYPQITFKLQHNGRQLVTTGGTGEGREAMASIYGPEVARQLLPVGYTRGMYCISGLVAKPIVYRKNRNHENIYVNGRFVRSRMISRAIEDAFKTLLPIGGYPVALISVSLPADEVDVNVHPTKSEVRFAKEKDVFLLVYQAIKMALQDAILVPGDMPTAIAEPQFTAPNYTATSFAFMPIQPRPHEVTVPAVPSTQPTYTPQPVKEIQFEERSTSYVHTSIHNDPVPPEKEETGRFPLMLPIGQIDSTYIVAQGADGMYLIDQHAAHERILYNRLMGKQQSTNAQTLLVPYIWELTPHEALILSRSLSAFTEAGFEIAEFGQNSYRVSAIPVGVPIALLGEILNDFMQDVTQDLGAEATVKKQHLLLTSVACKAAIKANAKLNNHEMQSLLHQLSETENPYTCPHGRPTVIHVSSQELAKRFKRIQ